MERSITTHPAAMRAKTSQNRADDTMKGRQLLTPLLTLTSLVLALGAWRQHAYLERLKTEQQQLLANLSRATEPAPQEPQDVSRGTFPVVSPPETAAASELLRLRNEVHRLTQRTQELASVVSENTRLQAEVAANRAKPAAPLPPGYIRKTQASLVGYKAPEDTLQSFLWSIRTRSSFHFLQAFTPAARDAMEKIMKQQGKSADDFFTMAQAFVGFDVLKSEPQGEDQVVLSVQITPDTPGLSIPMQRIGNEWKISSPDFEHR